jgi:hypothetical protein
MDQYHHFRFLTSALNRQINPWNATKKLSLAQGDTVRAERPTNEYPAGA